MRPACPVTPVNGTFQVQVYNTTTGLTQTSQIEINENGLSNDTTLNSLAAQLNGISGLSASVNSSGQLQISTTSPELQVAFAGDTSGTLAALGINTFFTGTDAASLSVNSAVANDPTTFATSAGGIGVDTQVAQQLAGFADLPLASAGGATISDVYNTSGRERDARIERGPEHRQRRRDLPNIVAKPAAIDQRRQPRHANRQHAAVSRSL